MYEFQLFQVPGRDISNTNVTSGRPDRICDGNKPGSQRSTDSWFDASCFALPAAGVGRFGNAGRGIIEGPERYWGVNLGLFKYFLNLRETVKARLQAQIRNLFNHPRFRIGANESDQGMNLVSPSLGRITRSPNHLLNDIWSERQIEVGIRLEF